MEVVSSLKSAAIFRLSESWLRISKTAMDNFKGLVDLMDCEKNFKNYRVYLNHLDRYAPCLPYHLITFLEMVFDCQVIWASC